MLALQSFSLPRSGPRVTARPCPPVVPRQRRRDYEALFRSEVRHSRGSWPNRTARCSPGLSPLGAPPERDSLRHARERAAMRGAEDPRAGGPIRWPCPRLQCHQCPRAGHTVCAGEEGRSGITATPDVQAQDRLRTTEVVSSPVSPLEGRSSSRVGPAAPREPVGRPPAHPPEGKRTAATSEVSWTSWPVVSTAEAIDPLCSAAFREVGGRRRGGPRGRWVDRVSVRHPGSGDRSKDPRIGVAKEGSSDVIPWFRPVAPAGIAAQRGPCWTSGVTCSKL